MDEPNDYDLAPEVYRIPIPSYYRQIASGEIMPVFDPSEAPRWLVLYEDGQVKWADRDETL